MRALIIGGGGFIGAHLAKKLLGGGADVTIIDNMPANAPAFRSRGLNHPRLKMRVGSVLDPSLTDSLIGKCDVVFHLASVVGPILVIERPMETMVTGVCGTTNVAQAASRHRVKVLYVSSSEVYGTDPDSPQAETMALRFRHQASGRSSYAASKIASEALLLAQQAVAPYPLVIARLFNAVGPGQSLDGGLVLPRMAAQAVANEPITVYGTGQQTRTFTHVTDVVAALMGLASMRADGPIVVNVGSDDEISILDLAQLIRSRAKSTSEIRFLPYAKAYGVDYVDQIRRVPDISYLRSLIAWTATKSLITTIDEVVAEMRQRGRSDAW